MVYGLAFANDSLNQALQKVDHYAQEPGAGLCLE